MPKFSIALKIKNPLKSYVLIILDKWYTP